LELDDLNIDRIPKFVHRFLTFDGDVLQGRWDACNGCEFLTDKYRCKKCGCPMRLKTRVAGMKCPIGKWDKICP
tara:strand:+ start:869 stop:1090 length:222 start_codon:yes stop_codon:yes gene_type:complete